MRGSLRHHRICPLRYESRHALLAYAYLRGRPYHQQEPKPKSPPDAERIRQIVRKFGDYQADSGVDDWLNG